jgi:hypothetical protein
LNTQTLIELHQNLQLKMPPVGRAPQDFEGEEQIRFIVDMSYALEDEIHEMTNAVGWKPWATDRRVDAEEMRGELIDQLHFFLNLWMTTFPPGTHPAEMAAVLDKMYIVKNNRNAQRMAEGYDGVTGKCPQCRRDWLDTLRHSESFKRSHLDDHWYCVCGREITTEEKKWLRSRPSAG